MDLDIEPDSLKAMRERGGKWAAYQNVDLSSPNQGHLQFLQYGEGRTYATPPKKMPDTGAGLGWRYQLVGLVDLEAGTITPVETPT